MRPPAIEPRDKDWRAMGGLTEAVTSAGSPICRFAAIDVHSCNARSVAEPRAPTELRSLQSAVSPVCCVLWACACVRALRTRARFHGTKGVKSVYARPSDAAATAPVRQSCASAQQRRRSGRPLC